MERLKQGAGHGLNYAIAEWMLEQGEPVSAYDVMNEFGITLPRAWGFLMVLEQDDAIEMKRCGSVPVTSLNGRLVYVRVLKVIAIDREKIALRHNSPYHFDYRHCKYNSVESFSDLTPAEKWRWIISHARRRKD
ncbi:hypothetical protein ABGY98_002833 [Salmonella enterica]|nr:hypothetical protein [Salmonella enterica]ECJ5893014.1 hypothetical protein [Salmonella enterica subsp. diarizonae]ECS3896958.1 hypothetical protein [Salmonella enterica subsp. diarizonae serovar 48:i:z]EAM6403919.1 hypothetical protein [Salmonella enterica]EAN2414913.1 hypothetical protein [Salmonella enterica]